MNYINIESFLSFILNNLDDGEITSSIQNIIANKYFKMSHSSEYTDIEDGEEFYQQYFYKYDVENELILKIISSERFLNWSNSFFKEIELFINSLNILNNKITLFRAISTEYDFIQKHLDESTKNISLGVCWSFKKEGAIPYHGVKKNNKHIIFQAEFDVTSIDFFRSILLNFSGDTSTEKEIRVFKDSSANNVLFFEKNLEVNELLQYELPSLELLTA